MLFKNANIFANGKFQYGAFRVENGKFAEILDTVPAEEGIDLEGKWVIPGLIDVHNHGNSNADFSDGDYEGVKAMAKFLASVGVTSFAPASMTLPLRPWMPLSVWLPNSIRKLLPVIPA